VVLSLTTAYLVAEVVGGLLTGSLALLADAGHMLADVSGLTMSFAALRMAARPATSRRTFGFHRAETLAAVANAVLLLGIAGFILYEAWQRFAEPAPVESVAMLIVAVGGLVVNLIGFTVLHGAAGESLNMRGALLEVVADLLGSVGDCCGRAWTCCWRRRRPTSTWTTSWRAWGASPASRPSTTSTPGQSPAATWR
jgi:cobalt-zinc-cadmium efflux system protein